jgi:hypothetical protein
MSWIRKSPFTDGIDPTAHMVALLAAYAEKAGTPLSEGERKLLIEGAPPPGIVGEESNEKFRKLIEQAFDDELNPDDPMSLSNSLQWAGDDQYPRIVALAEKVVRSRSEKFPQLRGRRLMVDRLYLVGCGFAAVVFMMVIVAFFSWFFRTQVIAGNEEGYLNCLNGFRIVSRPSMACPSCISSEYRIVHLASRAEATTRAS